MIINRIGAVLLAVGLLFTLTTVAVADSELCPALDSGKIDVSGDPPTVTFEAPDGFLITGYCVKAGPTAVFVTVDPPASSVVIDHPDKDSVSHYSVSYQPTTTTTEGPSTSADTTTTTSQESSTTTTTTASTSSTTTVPESTSTTAGTTTTLGLTSTTQPAPTTSVPTDGSTATPSSSTLIDTTSTGAEGTRPSELPFTGVDPGWMIFGAGLIGLGLTFIFGFRKDEDE